MSIDTGRQRGGFHLTDRDLDVWWLGRVRLARIEQIQARFGMARSKAYGRLQGLCQLGLVVHERRVPGSGVFLATTMGLRAVDLDLSMATVSFATFEHDLAVATVVAELESSDAELEVLTEREMRAEHRVEDGRRYAPRVHEPGRSRTGHHWPDLVIHYGEDRWLAVEVQLSAKTAARTTAILRGYYLGTDVSGLWGVLYLAPTKRDIERLKKLATSAGLGPKRDQGERESYLDDGREDVWFLAGRVDAIDGFAGCLAGYAERHVDAVTERERRRVERLKRERIKREQQPADDAARLAAYEREQRRQEAERAAAEAEAARPINRVKQPCSADLPGALQARPSRCRSS
jgi:hypothetical protein